MENTKEKALEEFLKDKETETEEEFNKRVEKEKEILINEDNSIIERIDRVFIINKEGVKKQLLREIY